MVEQVPLDKVQTDWFKLPPKLLVLQVTVPVGLNPETVAVQVMGWKMGTGFREQETDVPSSVTVKVVLPPLGVLLESPL